jgi:hypothetical protein
MLLMTYLFILLGVYISFMDANETFVFFCNSYLIDHWPLKRIPKIPYRGKYRWKENLAFVRVKSSFGSGSFLIKIFCRDRSGE